MPLWTGSHEQCFWTYANGQLDRTSFDAYLAALEQHCKKADTAVLLTVSYRSDAPNSVQRARMSTLISRADMGSKILRHGLASDSTMVRATATAMGWLVRKPFEERIFDDPTAALKWVAEASPGVNPDIVSYQIRRSVPSDLLWTKIGG